MARDQYSIETYPRAIINPDGKWAGHGVNNAYESWEISIVNGFTHQLSKHSAGSFTTVPIARKILIRTDSTITIYFNSGTNHAITLTSFEGSLEVDFIEITDIWIANASGSTASVKLLFS